MTPKSVLGCSGTAFFRFWTRLRRRPNFTDLSNPKNDVTEGSKERPGTPKERPGTFLKRPGGMRGGLGEEKGGVLILRFDA